MVTEIRIYIEGGGSRSSSKTALRQGFSSFLKEIKDCARVNRVGWNLIACGSRNEAYSDFKNALVTHINAFNVLQT